VQHRRHQRHPGRPAHEEHARAAGGIDSGVRHDLARQRDRALQERAGDPVEFLAREVRFDLEHRDGEVRLLVARQPLLGGADLLLELPQCPAFLHSARMSEGTPLVAVAVDRAEVLDERGVDVEAAEVGASGERDGPEPLGLMADDADVERARAEVVDDERGARRDGPAERLGEVGRGGDRFGDEPDLPEPGGGRGGADRVAALRAPVGGDGDRDLPGRADHAAAFDGDGAQEGGEQCRRGDLPVAQEYCRGVDVALGVGLEPLRVASSAVDGVAAHREGAVRRGVHRRRQQRRAVEQQRPHGAVEASHDADGVRGAEVDAEGGTGGRGAVHG
jgi:hypothetical protein